MKKMKFQVAALSMLLVLGSCQTKTGTGAAVGAGSGAALGAIGWTAQQQSSWNRCHRGCCHWCCCRWWSRNSDWQTHGQGG